MILLFESINVMSKKLIQSPSPISIVKFDLSWKELKISKMLFNKLSGAASKMSSTYL